jgi:hypothetical protein
VPLVPEPDLSVPAPPNRWLNVGDKALYAIYRSAWRLGGQAPAALVRLRAEMLASATASPDQQRQALATYRTRLPSLREHIRGCGAADDAIADALAWLEKAAAQ